MVKHWVGLLGLGALACGGPAADDTATAGAPGQTSAQPESGSSSGAPGSSETSTASEPPPEGSAESSTSGESSSSGAPEPSSGPAFDLGTPESEVPCQSLGPQPPLLDAEAGQLAAPFDELYVAHDLGPVDGVPAPLGGTIVSLEDPDVLLVVGESERVEGALYEVGVQRDNCGHIVSFEAPAKFQDVPFADANLVHAPGGVIVSQYPSATVSQVRGTALAITDLVQLGVTGPFSPSSMGSESPGGLGIVPAWIDAAGAFRVVAYPTGQWYRLSHDVLDGAVEFSLATPTVTLDHGPGAFAYVPPDSPGFAQPSIIVAEWFHGVYTPESDSSVPANGGPQRVGVYEVDDVGDPIVDTRRDFFEHIQGPWGAYFDPVSGDFLFLSWAQDPDRITQVRGFTPPPAG